MSRHAVPRALLLVLLALSLLPARSFAGCNVAVVANVAPTDPNGGAANTQITVTPVAVPVQLQHESTMERVSDVLIYDDTTVAGGNCFTVGNHFVLSYNSQLTSPASITAATSANFDVYDSSGTGLGIAAHSSSAFGANTTVTLIQVDVLSQGTAATGAGGITATPVGSALRVKNLRLDATTLAVGTFASVTVTATTGLTGAATKTVGISASSIAPGATVVQQGSGTQSSNSTLDTPEIFDYAENYSGAFRLASANASGVYGDAATTATKIVFDLGTSLPFGVSVTFPAKIQVGGTAGITLTLTSGGTCNGPTQCTAVYTTTANGPGVFDFTTTTAATPNTGEDGNLPAIGVFIANPSGYGTATLKVSLIPSHLASVGDVPTPVLSIAFFGGPAVTGGSAPAVTGISPATAVAGTPGTTLTVNGSGFTTASVIQWNGSARATTFVSSTQLTASLLASDLGTAGSGNVTVNNGGTLSNAATFTVTINPTPNSPFKYVLPHFISGSGYASRITIVNTSAQQNSVVLNFVSQSGVTLSTTTYDMAPGATVRVNTTDTDRYGSNVTKWATVGSQAPVLANVWYDYITTPGATAIENSVGFNDAAPVTDFSLPVEFQPGVSGVSYGKTVGLAIANPNAVAATATVKLVDINGTVLGTQTWTLPGYGQTAIDLSQTGGFASVLPSGDFVGSVTVSATSPVSSIAVQDNNGLFSAVPVGQGRAR